MSNSTSSTSPINHPYSRMTSFYDTLRSGGISYISMAAGVLGFHPAMMLKLDLQAKVSATAKEVKFDFEQTRKAPISKRFRMLYKGVGTNLWNAPPYAIMGVSKEIATQYFSQNGTRELTFKEQAVLSAGSGAVGAIPYTLLDLVILRQRLILNETKKMTSLGAVVRDTYLHGDLRGLFRGLPTTILREAPFGVAMLSVGPAINRSIEGALPNNLGRAKTIVATPISGTAMAVLCVFGTQYADTIKTSIQMDWKRARYPSYPFIYAGRDIFKEGGLQAVKALTDPNIKDHWVKNKFWESRSANTISFWGGVKALNAGGFWRGVMLSIASTIIIGTSDYLEQNLPRYR